MITKKELIEKVNNKDYNWFYDLYNNLWSGKNKSIEVVYDQNWGDGNDYFIAFHFKDHNLYVQLDGTYSSWDSPYWGDVYFASPYEWKEIRYEKRTLGEIRDDKIEEVLKVNDQKSD